MVPTLSFPTLVLASLALVGCGGAMSSSSLHPRMGDRGLVAARGQFGIEHGGARRTRVATPAWTIANFGADGTTTRTDAEHVHQARLDGTARQSEDVFELELSHTRLPARMWARTVPLPRALEQRDLATLAPGIVERSVNQRYWLFDDAEGAGPQTYQTRVIASQACQLDGLAAHEVLYEARTRAGDASHVHLVLFHALKPWVAGARGTGSYRPLVILGLSSRPEAHPELAPQLADLAHRVRVFDENGAARSPGASTCGALRSEPLRGTRYRVGDYVVYRFSGSRFATPLLMREEVTDQDGDRLTIEVTVSQEGGGIVRRWAQELIDTPENQAANRIEALCVFDGDACHDQPVETLPQLYADVVVSPDAPPTNVSESMETRPIGPLQLECSVRSGDTTIAGRPTRFEELRCPEFLWTNGNAAFVDVESGDFVVQVDIAEFGSPLGPWRWGTFGAPIAQ
ncbi:MAG: hypothetical protein J0L92_30415 [Deltaproteobacteria bacterium]|nr:hypothetical protein [Deltaproteobacteria bacterium]